MDPSPNDLQALRAADSAAVRSWFDTHVDGLFAFVFPRVGGQREVARDVTQAVFTHSLDRMKHFDPARGSMSTWLRMNALNEIKRARRRLQRELATDPDVLVRDWAEADTRELPAEAMARCETRDLVDLTLHNLPDHYRSILRHRYLEDASLADIAARSNREVSSVKPLLHRAREAFRAEFQRLAAAQS